MRHGHGLHTSIWDRRPGSPRVLPSGLLPAAEPWAIGSMLTSAAGTPVTPPDPAARPWQEGAGAAGLHGLTVCDAAWGCVMWGRRRTLAAQLKGPATREES